MRRHSRVLWPSILAGLFLVLVHVDANARGTQQFPPGVKVPWSNCPSNCPPSDDDPCCEARQFFCTRFDSAPYITDFGTIRRRQTVADCNNCFQDCPCCPLILTTDHDPESEPCAPCHILPPRSCSVEINLTHTETATVSLSAGFSMEASAADILAITSSLHHAIGVTVGETYGITGVCSWPSVLPCVHVRAEPFLEWSNSVKARVRHDWIASGHWDTAGWAGCGLYSPCLIAGTPWNRVCRTEYSTVDGEPYVRSDCGIPEHVPCPPESPEEHSS